MSVTRLAGRRAPEIDLATVRETLSLIGDDLAVDQRYAAICAALAEAVSRIDEIEAPAPKRTAGQIATQFASRFVPWRP